MLQTMQYQPTGAGKGNAPTTVRFARVDLYFNAVRQCRVGRCPSDYDIAVHDDKPRAKLLKMLPIVKRGHEIPTPFLRQNPLVNRLVDGYGLPRARVLRKYFALKLRLMSNGVSRDDFGGSILHDKILPSIVTKNERRQRGKRVFVGYARRESKIADDRQSPCGRGGIVGKGKARATRKAALEYAVVVFAEQGTQDMRLASGNAYHRCRHHFYVYYCLLPP